MLLTAPNAVGSDVPPPPSQRERLSLDAGWRFNPRDIPFPVISGHNESYNNAKAGTARGAAALDYDDSLWKPVDLPHDWSLGTPVDEHNNLSQGFHARGIGWYRRSFRLETADRGRHIELQFDGVATHCTVWINGLIAARNWCGYTSFHVDMTSFARYGEDLNTVAVRVDADAQEGWWYEGAGIYRHVWLAKRSPVHIATDGVFANPVRGTDGKWSVPVEVTLASSAVGPEKVSVVGELFDPGGKSVASSQTDASVDPFSTSIATMKLPVESPQLWSCETPTLYTVRTTVRLDALAIDAVTTRVGFRTIRFDADKGFFLNDRPVKLMGTCNHQDHAGIGVAVPDSLWEYRLRRLKEMGSNAYRCAHNAPAAEFLDAADRVGMLVMDENRNFNTTDEYVRQLQWMVRRDRNHPSVILWSVFNEEPFQGTEQGYEMVRQMSALVKQLDVTRPVTAAQSGAMMNKINASLAADVAGFNYGHGDYDHYHAAHPEKPMTSSEDTSAVMTRGEYITDKKTRFVVDSYDDQHQPWGASHRAAWRAIDTRPFVAGTFIWTGFDYRGEPQPLAWPATGSSFGIMDQCGFPKAAFYIHQAQWVKDRPVLQLIPHWNWPGREGKPVKVMAICNADAVELTLNGKVIGRQPVDPIDVTATWDVPYTPGKLEAVGYKSGKEVSRCHVETTGEVAALRLIPDRETLANDGRDAMPVTVQAVDAQGRVVPTAHPLAIFKTAGSGSIIGVANGDPICHESDQADRRSLYNGLAQAILQSTPDGSEPITLTAAADGLKPATVTIKLTQVPPIASVAVEVPVTLLRHWQQSPASNTQPDPAQQIGKTDMNTYTTVAPGSTQKLAGRYALLRTTFTPSAAIKHAGGRVVFKSFAGKAEVYIDGKAAARKVDYAPASFEAPVAPGERDHTIVIVLEAGPATSGRFWRTRDRSGGAETETVNHGSPEDPLTNNLSQINSKRPQGDSPVAQPSRL